MLRDEISINISLKNIELIWMIDDNEISRVAFAQQTYRQIVMLDRVNTCHSQHLKKVVAFLQRSFYVIIDMVQYQFIGMLIIATEHHFIRMESEYVCQRFKIFRRTAFTNQYVH